MNFDCCRVRPSRGTGLSSFFTTRPFSLVRCAALGVVLITILMLRPAVSSAHQAAPVSNDPQIEQQIDIQDSALTTTSTTYTDASGSGDFLWNSTRYASLAHVYFEAGIANTSVLSSTKRDRSSDLLTSLVTGTIYKVRIKYACAYNSSANTFKEMGLAALWTATTPTVVTASVVGNTINSGNGACPTPATTVAVRFSRLIILQSASSVLTDTDTSINLGQAQTSTFADTNDYPLQYPKIWMFTDHTLHPAAGWDSIQDVLFSATLASPTGSAVSACLYDITRNSPITCVSTASTTPTYVSSGDVSTQLTDGDQYETYLSVNTPSASVSLYNAFVTVEQSNAAGLFYFELYNDYNPYPVTSTATSYAEQYFMNDWEPANFNLNTANMEPATNEVLSFHVETTEQTTASSGSAILYAGCIPGGKCPDETVYNSTMTSANTSFTRIRTPDNAFGMWPNVELDSALEVTGTGSVTSTVTWLIVNVNILATYAEQETMNLAYGPNAYETYDQCLPENAPPNRPGLVLIHGGSWIGGTDSKALLQTFCNAYAAQGFAVYDIDYRLANLKTGGSQWPDQIGDVQLAVRYMRANASQSGVDPTRICSYGDSSGSQLALLLDELQTIHTADVATIDATYSPTTQCALDLFGPTDLALLYTENPSLQSNLYALLDDQTPTSDPGIYQDASPVDNIAPQTGPVLICQGTEDTTVPPEQAQELQQDLQAASIPYNYLQYVGGHALTGLLQGQANMIDEEINAYVVAQEHP